MVARLAESEIETVAIALLHAYANPAHEQRLAARIREKLPRLDVSLSSVISPEIREYERWSTAVANAYVQPVIERYLGRLDAGLRSNGFDCPLFLITSGGGLDSLGEPNMTFTTN